MAERGVWGADVHISKRERLLTTRCSLKSLLPKAVPFPLILGEALQAPMKLLPTRACKPFLPFFIWKPCLGRSRDFSAVRGIAHKSMLFPCSVLPCYFWSKLLPCYMGLSPCLLHTLPAAPRLAGLGGVTRIKSGAQWLQKRIVSWGARSMINT